MMDRFLLDKYHVYETLLKSLNSVTSARERYGTSGVDAKKTKHFGPSTFEI